MSFQAAVKANHSMESYILTRGGRLEMYDADMNTLRAEAAQVIAKHMYG